MFVAFDNNENRIYADEYDGSTPCFCPVCGEQLTFRKGSINRPHFAHKAKTDCIWGLNKDYKSEWHIRMQDYFPKYEREVRFIDSDSGEVHIADIFVEHANTVIEFQKSPITEDEFLSRTVFHLNSGRKIVWVFDESREKPGIDKGRFRADEQLLMGWPYSNLCYRWMRQPRKFLNRGPALELFDRYSVCVWTGTENDILHRIVHQKYDFEYVVFSLHNIVMSNRIDVNDFFKSENEWAQESPLKEELEQERQEREEIQRKRLEAERRQLEMMRQTYRRPIRRGRRRF